MTVDFVLTGNFSSSSEGIAETSNITTASNNIESLPYSDTLSLNGDRWILDSNSSITVSGLEQSPSTVSTAEYILPLTVEFDFQIDLNTLLLGQDNLQYIQIYDDSSNELKFGLMCDATGLNIQEYTQGFLIQESFSDVVGTYQVRVIKHSEWIYLYINDGVNWQIITSEQFSWLNTSSLRMKLVTEKISSVTPTVYWENLTFQNGIEFSTPSIWRSKPVGDHLTIPPLLPHQYDLINWKTIEVDNVPQHGILYCQCSDQIMDPSTYVPNLVSPQFTGPMIQFNSIGPVWQADISSLGIISKYLCVRLIMAYTAVPYQDFREYQQYIFNLTLVPFYDVTLDYVPVNNEVVITEQGLTQSSTVDWEFLDSRTIRIRSLVSNSIEPNTHLRIQYQIPRV